MTKDKHVHDWYSWPVTSFHLDLVCGTCGSPAATGLENPLGAKPLDLDNPPPIIAFWRDEINRRDRECGEV